MGIFDFFRRTVTAAEVMNEVETGELLFAGPMFARLAQDVDNMSVGDLWESQPHLRTVTTFIAKQISSVSVHVFRHMPDGGRERVRSNDPEAGEFAALMSKVNSDQLMQELLESTILDFLLHDEFLWVVGSEDYRPVIRQIRPYQIAKIHFDGIWGRVTSVDVAGDDGRVVKIPADQIIRRHGFSPKTSRYGTSPVTSLRETLKEQLEASAYRSQLWKNGPRLGGVISRPKDAPKWEAVARRRFQAAWRSQYSGRGSGAGGTPVLEDGMTFQPAHLKAQDEQVVEMTTLSLKTVAQVFHVNPTMVGVLEATNYSNVKEFRKSLYGDSLGPLIKYLEGVFNEFLRPMIDAPDDVYAEFNIEEKLRGSFEEQGAIIAQSTGAPWMTVNEARSMRNLPAIEGGDVLIRPLNVAAASDDEPQEPPQDPPVEGEEP